jgi:CRP-like cAMP-binding protein
VIYVGDDPSLVKQFVKYLAPKTVLKEEEIIRQGDEGDYFYCIESGKYDVLVNGKKVSEFDNKVVNEDIIHVYIVYSRDVSVKSLYFTGTKFLLFFSTSDNF